MNFAILQWLVKEMKNDQTLIDEIGTYKDCHTPEDWAKWNSRVSLKLAPILHDFPPLAPASPHTSTDEADAFVANALGDGKLLGGIRKVVPIIWTILGLAGVQLPPLPPLG